MKKISIIFVVALFFITGCKRKKITQDRLCSRVDLEQIINVFPKTSEEIYMLAEQTIELFNDAIKQIDLVPAEHRSYVNTLSAYERAYFQFFMHQQLLKVIADLSPDSGMQTAANVALLDLQEFEQKVLKRNLTFYQAFQEYEKHGKDPYRHIKPVTFFLQNKLAQAKHDGLRLSVPQRAELVELEQNLKCIAGKYCSNVIHDQRYLIATERELVGLQHEILQTFSRDDQGNYVVPVSAKMYHVIMQHCQNSATRRNYFLLYQQIGYPQNESVLADFKEQSSQLAKMVGYDNFASYQMDRLMVKNPKKVESFLWSMIKELQPIDDANFGALIRQLPAGVTLTNDKKIEPWDYEFVCASYRAKHFKINDGAVAEYFPLDHVLPTLLTQLSKFFYVTFEKQEDFQVWAPGVVCYRVRSMKHQGILGYLFFDLHKRFAKRESDPYEFVVIPAIRDDCSFPCAGATVVVANFDENSADSPTLLSFADLCKLVYQMGGALHTIFGATRFTEFSGGQVAYDFIKVPSETLSLWLTQPNFVQSLSQHVRSGEHLNRDVVQQLIAREKFGQTGKMLQDLFLSLVALQIFEQDSAKVHGFIEKLYKKVFRHIAYTPMNYFEMSMVPLTNIDVGTAYYAGPWSKVIAADLFDQILERGIFDHEMGMDYVTEILSHGGSRTPYEMLKKFLGRSFQKKPYLEQQE